MLPAVTFRQIPSAWAVDGVGVVTGSVRDLGRLLQALPRGPAHARRRARHELRDAARPRAPRGDPALQGERARARLPGDREPAPRDHAHRAREPRRQGDRGRRGARVRHRAGAARAIRASDRAWNTTGGSRTSGINTSEEHALREFALLVGGPGRRWPSRCIAVAALAIDRLVPLVPPALEARWFGGLGALAEQDGRPARRAGPGAARPPRRALERRPYPFRVGVLDEPDPERARAAGRRDPRDQRGCSTRWRARTSSRSCSATSSATSVRATTCAGSGAALALQLVLGALGGSGEIVSGLAAFAGALAQRGFDRRQESEADAFGLALVHAEYGHVAGAARLLRAARARGARRAAAGPPARALPRHPPAARGPRRCARGRGRRARLGDARESGRRGSSRRAE